MLEVYVASGAAISPLAAFFILIYKYIMPFDRNFNAIMNKLMEEKQGSAYVADRGYLKKLKDDVSKSYSVRRRKAISRTFVGFALMAGIVFLLTLSVSRALLSDMRWPAAVLSIQILVTVLAFVVTVLAFVAHWYFVNTCATWPSSSASNPKLWLGAIFPSIPTGGNLNIVLGSMNPELISEEWFLKILDWLKTERGVTIRIATGEPCYQEMNQGHLQVLQNLQDGIKKYHLESSFRLLPERPRLQFVVTDNLVRIEQEHNRWTRRTAGTQVPNHIHFFAFPLINRFFSRFQYDWSTAKPVEQVVSRDSSDLKKIPIFPIKPLPLKRDVSHSHKEGKQIDADR